ncbi:unnamed protein product [Durusdinium trenchii]|uniref:RED-like N-terminal domain-containing protein n=1 Tax=Durusdinium trenchii TaxID=1381693 RepID=A0ABP0J612_9DINO
MFGPDRCGATNKVHFILQHKSPVTGLWEEKHLSTPPSVPSERRTHLYSLLIRPDNTVEVRIDGEKTFSGSLLQDMQPPVNPPQEIDDPTDSKPADWVDNAKMDDPEPSKPDDWDEDAPFMIPDPSASMPSGWLEDEPLKMADPKSKRPDDWDDEEDGEWEAPVIENPKCTVGCGKWEAPKINNPAYKGKWYAPKIDNPAYIGEWKPRQIANPEYFVDESPYKIPTIDSIGIDIWTMDKGIIFDNIVVDKNPEKVVEFGEATFKPRSEIEDKSASSESLFSQYLDWAPYQAKMAISSCYCLEKLPVFNNPVPVLITIVAQLVAKVEGKAKMKRPLRELRGLGDLEHTHLVKGLDFALLNKVRAELNKQKKVEEIQKAKQQQRKPGEKKRTFENRIAKNVWLTVVDTLHPHHSTFKERVQRMGKAIAQGHRIRNAPSMFLPGRMAYEFDTELEMGKTDIPRIVYMSKEEIAPSERGKLTSGMLPETAVRVRNAMQKAAEERKKRKEKNLAAGTAYAAQKVEVSKFKARDSDNDIFSGAGSFDANEFVQKARAEQAAKQGPQSLQDAKAAKEVPPKKKVEAAPPQEKDPRKRKAAKSSGSGPQGMGNPGNDAYDELFPNAMMGGAMMTTHSDDSDEDEAKKKKDKKGADKKKVNEDTVTANKKSAAAEAKKRKMTENQQWQKIDNMIKKGKVSSMESMEQQASKKTGKTSHLATPAFF